MKPGIKTTEFWLVTIKSILLVGMSLAVAIETQDWEGVIVAAISAFKIADMVSKYVEGRSLIKSMAVERNGRDG